MLLTNLVTINLEAALIRIKWYKYRWRIELFHKILKSGYRVENCRLSPERIAANGDVLHNDDSHVKITDVIRHNRLHPKSVQARAHTVSPS